MNRERSVSAPAETKDRMKILLVRPPRFLCPLLRKLCGVKKEK